MHSVSAFLLLYVLFYCLHAINYFLTFIMFCDFPIFYFPLYTISFCEWLSNTNVTCHANQASWNWKNKLGVQCDGDTSQLHDVIFMKWDKFKRAETGMRDWQIDRIRRGRAEQTAFCNHTFSVCYQRAVPLLCKPEWNIHEQTIVSLSAHWDSAWMTHMVGWLLSETHL